jgi:hypothetical protein
VDASRDSAAPDVASIDAARDASADAAPDVTSAPDTGPTPCVGLLCDTSIAFPATIRETGVFGAPPDFNQRPERVRAYVPSPELWSDGLHKLRNVLLPPGARVDTAAPEKWAFPTNTVFIKTFLDDGPAGTRRPIETRFIRRRASGYDFAAYRWNTTGTDAVLVDNADDTRIPVPVTVAGKNFTHNIPSQRDCRACHLANQRIGVDDPPRSAFIGFDELRLASTAGQLDALHAAGVLTAKPANPATITDPDPRLLRVKRFVFGNCAHCHHGDGVFDLRPNVFVANTVNQMVMSSGITAPPGYRRVLPGDPEKSVVFLQMRATNLPATLRPMPPVGVQFPPADEVENLRAWISLLP